MHDPRRVSGAFGAAPTAGPRPSGAHVDKAFLERQRQRSTERFIAKRRTTVGGQGQAGRYSIQSAISRPAPPVVRRQSMASCTEKRMLKIREKLMTVPSPVESPVVAEEQQEVGGNRVRRVAETGKEEL